MMQQEEDISSRNSVILRNNTRRERVSLIRRDATVPFKGTGEHSYGAVLVSTNRHAGPMLYPIYLMAWYRCLCEL